MKRKASRRHARRKGRKHSRNPLLSLPGGGSIKSTLGVYRNELIPQGIQFGAGALLGLVARTKLVNRLLPSTVTGWRSYAAGLAVAAPMLLIPKYGRKMAAGAVGAEIIRLAMDKGGPLLRGMGLGELAADDDLGDDGMDEYATVQEMRRLGEYATVGEVKRLGEYATVSEVEEAADGSENPVMY